MSGHEGTPPDSLRWRISVPVFRNRIILRQLGIAVGIPFGLVALIIGLASGRSVYTLYALGLVAALLLLSWLFIMAVYRGRYDAEFVLDGKGARCFTQEKQAKRNRVINTLAVWLGLLSGRPAAAGAGLLARSRQDVLLPWGRIRSVSFRPRQHTILLRGGWTENIALFCNRENYALAERFVAERTRRPSEVGLK